MTLFDITDPNVFDTLDTLQREGFEIVRISFSRGYVPVGHSFVSYGHDRKGRPTAAIYVPNRRFANKSSRYCGVIRLVNYEDLPF